MKTELSNKALLSTTTVGCRSARVCVLIDPTESADRAPTDDVPTALWTRSSSKCVKLYFIRVSVHRSRRSPSLLSHILMIAILSTAVTLVAATSIGPAFSYLFSLLSTMPFNYCLTLLAAVAALLVAPSDAFLPAKPRLVNRHQQHTLFTDNGATPAAPIKYINGNHAADTDTSIDGFKDASVTTTESATSTTTTTKTTKAWKTPVHHNVCPQTGVTLSRYMMEMERLNPELEEVESIFTSIQVGCKAISKLVRTSSLCANTGLANGGGSINVQGEEQKKMDIMANDCLKNALRWAGHFRTIASEEEEDVVDGSSPHPSEFPEALVDSSASYIAVSRLCVGEVPSIMYSPPYQQFCLYLS